MRDILFVCVENSCRSQMAEGFFNSMVPSTGKALASSAGAKPAKEINPLAVAVMKEVGIDISHQRPKLLTYDMVEKATKIITMGCLDADSCPVLLVKDKDKLKEWRIEDPAGKPIEKFREVREKIRWKVDELIKDLQKEV